MTEHFHGSGFGIFAGIVAGGGVIRAIPAPGAGAGSRKFFDDMNNWARAEGYSGLGYINIKDGELGGPIAKNHGPEATAKLIEALGLGPNDGVFFAAGKEAQAAKLAGLARTRVGEQLDLIDKDRFELCWIVDFPFFEYDEDDKKIDFAHNPFSMPQGGLEALDGEDPLTHQGVSVRHGLQRRSRSRRARSATNRPRLMVKAFEMVGLSQGGCRGALRRALPRVPVWRAAAWRDGRGRRPHRHAAVRRAEPARDHAVPDEPARRGPADGRAVHRELKQLRELTIRVIEPQAKPAAKDVDAVVAPKAG